MIISSSLNFQGNLQDILNETALSSYQKSEIRIETDQICNKNDFGILNKITAYITKNMLINQKYLILISKLIDLSQQFQNQEYANQLNHLFLNKQIIIQQSQQKILKKFHNLMGIIQNKIILPNSVYDQSLIQDRNNIFQKNNQLENQQSVFSRKEIRNTKDTSFKDEDHIINLEVQNQLKNRKRSQKFAQSINLIFIIIIINYFLFQHIVFNPQQQFKIFDYQLLPDCSINQQEWLIAMAFNLNNTILATGGQQSITLYKFDQGKIEKMTSLNEHKDYVRSIYFMKKSNQLISGSDDKNIIIWEADNQKWKVNQILTGHTKPIQQLLMNDKEDLIISCSKDNKIKFWVKKIQWECVQTISDHNSDVLSISLNQEQNQLISSGKDNIILVMEYLKNKQIWIVKQKIKVDIHGRRLAFVDNDRFAFQPQGEQELQVYKLNEEKDQYEISQLVKVKYGKENHYFFPQQFILRKQLLLNKNGNYVNLIRKKMNGELVNEQYIEYGSSEIFGTMDDNGEYLLTWDKKSKKILIRKFNEI